jgi:hypothetical protein
VPFIVDLSTIDLPGSQTFQPIDERAKEISIRNNDPRRVVVLVFSPRCGFCITNMPDWKAILQSIDRNSYRIVAVSIISDGVKEYVSQQKLTDAPSLPKSILRAEYRTK